MKRGDARYKTYTSWLGIIQRGTNPRCPDYPRYGGRGITVCQRWRSFSAFLEDMGLRPADMTIDRIDNNRGYEPGNCRWATRFQQQQNRCDTHLLTLNGKTMCIEAWRRHLGFSKTTIANRLRAGWTVEETLTTPIQKQFIRPGNCFLMQSKNREPIRSSL